MSQTDYKNTLNLPKTAFPMKANLAQREPEMLKHWQSIDLYRLMQSARSADKKFILNDGPPYANGPIHIGHAVNKILKDFVLKSKTLSGYQAPYIPGWDCHGLPVEVQVEKKVGKAGGKLSHKEFRQKCREYVLSQIDLQREGFMRLGVQGDWLNPYMTMAPQFEADIIRSMAKIVENGHLNKGERPVHWCINCGSALAEAEVEYADKTSPSIYVAFPVVDQKAIAHAFDVETNAPVSVIIWTTTPWTLPANQAVCLGSEIDYVLVKVQANMYIVAEALLADVAKHAGWEDFQVMGQCKGAALEHQLLQHPFQPRKVPILLGEHVTLESGTGCVHTAPGHGHDDYLVCLRYDIEIINPVNSDGIFIEETPLVGGQKLGPANEVIIDELKRLDHLVASKRLEHSYPHCWRHKTPLIFRATPQWFISMEKQGLREVALDSIKKVKWIPEWGQARIESMIAGRPDWCISRQRTWGVPLALFVHRDTGEIHPNTVSLMEEVAQRVEQQGIDAWDDLEASELLGDEAPLYEKSQDTLDVWFDSGTVHHCVLDRRPELHSPADLYLEGSDQHRGWFQSSLLTSVAMKGEAPYRQVLTHGFTVDAQGRKMSKSLGNVVAPDKVMKTLGADIIRLWVAATDYKGELHVSDEILKRTSDTYRRIRNTARFLLANLNGFEPNQDKVEFSSMLALDQWIVSRAKQRQEEIIQAYEAYQFHVVYQKLHHFCTVELGSFYLDVIKDRQYTCMADSVARRSAQTALYLIAEAMVCWMAPILSFTADEVWTHLPGERGPTVFVEEWFDGLESLPDASTFNDSFWQEILVLRDAVNKELENKRANGMLGSGLEAEVTLFCDDSLKSKLDALEDELRFVLITSQAVVKPMAEKTDEALETEISGLAIHIAASAHEKCQRCWHRREDVNQNPSYPNVCGRCVENLNGGEKRVYA